MRNWLIAGCLLLIFPALVVAQASDEDTLAAVEAYTQGQELLNNKDADGAIKALNKALKLNPELGASHYYLGFAYKMKGDEAKAKQHFETFIKAGGPADMIANAKAAMGPAPPSPAAKGMDLAKKKQYAQAIPELKKAVAANDKDWQSHWYLGYSLYQTKDHATAAKHFNKVIQQNPKLAPPYYYAGRIAYAKKDTATAKRQFAAFIQRDPDSKQAIQAHYMLGSLLAQEGDAATAAEHFEKYLATNPTGPQADQVKQFMAQLEAAAAAAEEQPEG